MLYILPHILYIPVVIMNSCYGPYSPDLKDFILAMSQPEASDREKGGRGGGGGGGWLRGALIGPIGHILNEQGMGTNLQY